MELPEKDWLAGELTVNSAKGRVLIDTGAGVNITTKAFAERASAKITVGPKIQMTFADGRESICHLQAEMQFAMNGRDQVHRNVPSIDQSVARSGHDSW